MKRRSKKTPVHPEIELRQIEEDIRRRAHALYEQRGKEDGHDLEDWLRAEGEIIRNKVVA